MPVGSELAPYTEYLLGRARGELNVIPRINPLAKMLAPLFVRVLGVPEIGIQIRAQHMMRHIPKTVRSVVDVGCGAGMTLGEIRRRRPGAQLTGIEIDVPSASLAAKAHPDARIITGDVLTKTEALRGLFDCAVCIDVLEHVPDGELAQFASVIAGLLVPGGTAIVHVPAVNQRRHLKRFEGWGHHDHEREGFDPEQLGALLTTAGLEVIAIKGTGGYGASLAWELNMACAASPLQALAFPPLLALASISDRLPSKKMNGVLAVATKPFA
jgi:SAM-dependent methyltransferase